MLVLRAITSNRTELTAKQNQPHHTKKSTTLECKLIIKQNTKELVLQKSTNHRHAAQTHEPYIFKIITNRQADQQLCNDECRSTIIVNCQLSALNLGHR
jgi:hypothetical protein